MHDLIVIGTGPAGLAAASYARSKQLDVVVIGTRIGGKAGDRQQLAGQYTREELLGEETVNVLMRQLAAHPDCLVNDVVVGVFKRDGVFHVLTETTTWHAWAVIVATGALPRMLGLPNERQLIGHGLGYSITTHAHLVTGRDVAVVGTTARALRGVAELVQHARSVALIAPEPGQLESPLGQRVSAHPRVYLLPGYHVTAVEASAGAVHAIVVARGDTLHRLPVQAVFVDLGLVPNVQMVRQLVQLDAQGFIVVDEQHQTSLPGLFAAGDVTSSGDEQMLIAVGDGVRAARSAYSYILEQRLEHAQLASQTV